MRVALAVARQAAAGTVRGVQGRGVKKKVPQIRYETPVLMRQSQSNDIYKLWPLHFRLPISA